jgi:hypothetical protein
MKWIPLAQGSVQWRAFVKEESSAPLHATRSQYTQRNFTYVRKRLIEQTVTMDYPQTKIYIFEGYAYVKATFFPSFNWPEEVRLDGFKGRSTVVFMCFWMSVCAR